MAAEDPTKTRHTPESIKALPSTGKRYRVADSEVSGLSVVVTETGAKRWQVRYYADGRRQTFTIGDAEAITPTSARAKAKKAIRDDEQTTRVAKRAEVKREREEERQAERRTLGTFLEKTYEPQTLRRHRSGTATNDRIRHVWASLLDKDMAALTRADVQRVVNARLEAGRDTGTLRRDVGALRALLNEAKRHGLIADLEWLPGFKDMKLTKPENRIRWLGKHDAHEDIRDTSGRKVTERERFMAALADERTPAYLRTMTVLALNTGLRRGEMFGLRWEDIDFAARQLTVTAGIAKTAKRRHVQLNDAAVAALTDWRRLIFGDALPGPGARRKLVFESTDGQRFVTVKKSWAALLARAQVTDFRLHDCRHDFASRLVMAGVDLYRVSQLLGHSSVTMTEKYAHLAPHSLQAAVNVLDGVRS